MMSRLVICFVAAALAALPISAQTNSAKEIKAGETIQLGEGLTAKIAKSTTSAFAGVKVKGEPVVVVLEFDAGKKSTTVFYKPSADARSEIYLGGGREKIAPVAVMEDFPSLGGDNDKEVEVLDPKEGPSGGSIEFSSKGSISILFDVPAAQAKSANKLSISFRITKPKQELYAFVVNL